MDPLYDELLQHEFNDSSSAVDFCRTLAFNAGFTVKQEASANRVSIRSSSHFILFYFGILSFFGFYIQNEWFSYIHPISPFIIYYFLVVRVRAMNVPKNLLVV